MTTESWFQLRIDAATDNGDIKFALWLEALLNDWKRHCPSGKENNMKKQAKKKPAKKAKK